MNTVQPAAAEGTPWWRAPWALALVAAHLVPLAGVLLAHWPMYPLMLLFWVENVIVGLYNVPKLILASAEMPAPWTSDTEDSRDLAQYLTPVTFPLFFIFHYGMFTMVHGIFLIAIFGAPVVGKEMMNVAPDTLLPIVWEQLSRQGLFIAVIALAASHGVSFWTNYVQPRRYLELTKKEVMMAPYGRVIALHLVIIGGAFAIQWIGPGPLPLVALVLIKTGMDLAAHLKEHRAAAGGGDIDTG